MIGKRHQPHRRPAEGHRPRPVLLRTAGGRPAAATASSAAPAIGKGRIAGIDTTAAEAAPGVRLVLTHRNAPQQGPFVHKPTIFDRPHPQLTSDTIAYYGEPVAFVVADTFEQARAAAALVKVDYAREDGRLRSRQLMPTRPSRRRRSASDFPARRVSVTLTRHGGGSGHHRPDLFDALPFLPADGAARLSRRLARRPSHTLSGVADGRATPHGLAETLLLDAATGHCRCGLCRRRLRLQALSPRRGRSRRPGGTRN